MYRKTSMKKICTTAIALCAALLFASAAPAQVTLNSVRVAAKDTVALAKFYQAAFGMQEVNRIDVAGGPEIFVNFGATVDAAKEANPNQAFRDRKNRKRNIGRHCTERDALDGSSRKLLCRRQAWEEFK